MRGNIVPRPPYFGGEFMGVEPPTPYTRLIASLDAVFAYPCLDVTDGSYYSFANGNQIQRYNNNLALIWSLAPTNLGTFDKLVGIAYNPSGQTIVAAYNSPTKAMQLFRLTSPASSTANSAIGSQFTLTNTLTHYNQDTCVLIAQPDGSYVFRYADVYSAILDVSISAGGAKLSESLTTQALSYTVHYISADGTIQAGGIGTSSGRTYMTIIRNKRMVRVPINFLHVPDTTTGVWGGFRLYGDYVAVSATLLTSVQFIGCTGFVRSSFDRWLHDVADKLGL